MCILHFSLIKSNTIQEYEMNQQLDAFTLFRATYNLHNTLHSHKQKQPTNASHILPGAIMSYRSRPNHKRKASGAAEDKTPRSKEYRPIVPASSVLVASKTPDTTQAAACNADTADAASAESTEEPDVDTCKGEPGKDEAPPRQSSAATNNYVAEALGSGLATKPALPAEPQIASILLTDTAGSNLDDGGDTTKDELGGYDMPLLKSPVAETALVIGVEGKPVEMNIECNDPHSDARVEQIQSWVKGFFEMKGLKPGIYEGVIFFSDEESLMKGLEVNHEANRIYLALSGRAGTFRGPVVVLRRTKCPIDEDDQDGDYVPHYYFQPEDRAKFAALGMM